MGKIIHSELCALVDREKRHKRPTIRTVSGKEAEANVADYLGDAGEGTIAALITCKKLPDETLLWQLALFDLIYGVHTVHSARATLLSRVELNYVLAVIDQTPIVESVLVALSSRDMESLGIW